MMNQYNLLKNRANSENPLLTKKKHKSMGNKILSCIIELVFNGGYTSKQTVKKNTFHPIVSKIISIL